MPSLRAALVLLLVAWSAGGRARADGTTPEYTQSVQLGVEEFEQRNFLEARTHLLHAHELYPNARTLRALGMVEFELKNYTDASRYLQHALTISEKPLDGDKRKEAELLLKRASGYLARITLEIAPDTVVAVDGTRSDLSSGDDLVLTLGDHELEFQAPGRIGQKRALKIQGGERYTLRVALAPLREAKSGAVPDIERERRPVYKSPWLWTAVGVLVAGAAAGTAIALTRDTPARHGAIDEGTGMRTLVGPSQ